MGQLTFVVKCFIIKLSGDVKNNLIKVKLF